jgi:hypothetical protein
MTANQVEDMAASRAEFIAKCAWVNGRGNRRQALLFDTT